MTNSTKTVLTLALALLAWTPSQAGGYRRGSYGGGYRGVARYSRTRAPGYRSAGRPHSRGYASTYNRSSGYSGGQTYGQMQSVMGYGGGTAGYSRALNGRSFGSSQSLFSGSSMRSFGTRYDAATNGGATTDQPVQGFAVPGAL